MWWFRHYPQCDQPFLYRGVKRSEAPIIMVDPSTTLPRHSADNSDLYRMLYDESNPGWPRRDESLICTVEESYANTYGEVYAVFPDPSASLACANRHDFWSSSTPPIQPYRIGKRLEYRVRQAVWCSVHVSDSDIDDIMRMVHTLNQPGTTVTPEYFTETMTKIKHMLGGVDVPINQQNPYERVIGEWLTDRDALGDDLLHSLLPIFNYETTTSCTRTTPQQLMTSSPTGLEGKQGEVWFSAPALMVSMNCFEDVRERVRMLREA